MKRIKRIERRTIIITSLITNIYLIMWVMNLVNVELQMIVPYIALNIFFTVLVSIFFLACFGGINIVGERMILEKLSNGDDVEVSLKKIINSSDEDTYLYRKFKEKGAKFYAKLYGEDEVFLSVEYKGKEEYSDYLVYEIFKKNFKVI